MTIPALLFALLLALLLGALYHFVRDGGAWHLFVYLVASVLGFVVGHLVGLWRGWSLFQIGPLNLGAEAIGGMAFLVAADLLLHMEPRPENEEEKAQ
ncbi:MAG: hypothetical protein AB1750_10395 [Chloroflexota bacterium]